MNRSSRRWPLLGLAAQAVLLAALGLTVGLNLAGAVLAVVLGTAVAALLGLAVARTTTRFGPANVVTLGRASLVVGVAALLPRVDASATVRWTLVALAAATLLLDLVDGRVARATDTVSRLGARFDMEVDALLILLLCVGVVEELGWMGTWVLLIGAARYLLWLAERSTPWLRRPTPVRPWAKVVAAVQGVALTVACAEILPTGVVLVVLATALALLVESFAWQVRWLARNRGEEDSKPVVLVTVVASLVAWVALVAPDRVAGTSVFSLLRIPVEAAALLLLAVVLPRRAARVAAVVAGLLLAVVLVLKGLDAGFTAAFDRPFDPMSDWYYFGPGFGLLGDSIGRGHALAAAGIAIMLVLLLAVTLPLSLLRLAAAARRGRRRAIAVAAAIATGWAITAATGLTLHPATPLAASSTASQAVDEVVQLRSDLADQRVFAHELGNDRYANHRPSLAGLRGKDVLLVFIESYGRVAVQDSDFSPAVDAALRTGTAQLRAAGYRARSGFLTSPTFGGASWLAHSTLESGLWVDSQLRYDQLVDQPRLTLADAFRRAGWRTVFDVPSITRPWPQGQRFYHYAKLYDEHNVGYHGPRFSYASMPDQFTLAALRRLELTRRRDRPTMAEIDLVSSHTPWTPLPHLIAWDRVGDGSAFRGMPSQGLSPDVAFRSAETVRELYGRSIIYTWQALVSFLSTYRDPNLVVIALGDHQPHSEVSGTGSDHDVPISVIVQDPSVVRAIASWGWQSGLLPRPDAPLWRMDRFRDAFFAAFDRPTARGR